MEVNIITQEEFSLLKDLLEELNTKVAKIAHILPNHLSDIWLDNQETSKILHVTNRTLQRYRDERLITFSQIGSKILYKRSDVERFLANHQIIAME